MRDLSERPESEMTLRVYQVDRATRRRKEVVPPRTLRGYPAAPWEFVRNGWPDCACPVHA